MTVHLTAMVVIHLVFAGIWAGAVVFTAYGVLPTIGTGPSGPTSSTDLLGRLTTVSRASAVVLLVTGGAIAGEEYGGGRLLGTTDGWLVILMVLLWVALAALVEIGVARTRAQIDAGEAVAPGQRWVFRVAAAVAIGLLVVGGLVSA